MATFSFRHLPVFGPKDTTANFEQLVEVLTRIEKELAELRTLTSKVKT